MRSPDQELSTTDHGDDMQRRVRFQAMYIASKAISMLDPESEIESLFCEQHEDCLVRLKRGGFAGLQVKTRILSRNPLGATDEDILRTVSRFIELDTLFPTAFDAFCIASNHGFRSDKTGYSLDFLIAEAMNCTNEPMESELVSYVGKVNKETKTSFSVPQLKQVFKKSKLEPTLPQFDDFETIIAEQIGKQTEYAQLPLPKLKDAATVVINKVFSMSSLKVPRLIEAVLKVDPQSYESEQIIASKLLTPQMVRAVLQSAIAPSHKGPPISPLTNTERFDFSEETLTAAKEAFRKHSKRLLEWPTTLGGSERIETASLVTLRETVSHQSSSTQLVLAPPGAGKSALLAMFSNEFNQGDNVVLALRVDQLPSSTDSLEKLQTALELEYPLLNTVAELAKWGKVIIVLDQLDALSELTCLNPQRLLVLLTLIEKLAAIENVHVVASAREFDADHDPHLRRIEAQRINLPLPEWKLICPILDSRKIKHESWPEDFKMLLRTPQYLKIFLDIQTSEQGSVFKSYRGLLNSLWRLRVENVDGIDESMLEQIAERMSKFEELTVPVSAFADNRASIERFVSGNIIQEDIVNGSIAFTHQTLFEYVRARTFLKGNESLSVYVNTRQTSLFIRPQLWHTLGFMREGGDGQYRIELSALLQNGNLRFHLRFLVIEFLGQLSQPKDYEMALVLPLLTDKKVRSTILSSLVGSPGWFQKLSVGFLPGLMHGSKEDSDEIIPLLRAAVNFDKETVLTLIEQNWASDQNKDLHTLSVLDSLANWCDRSLTLACTVVERSAINSHAIDRMCAHINATSGNRAIDLLLSHLKSEARIAKNEIPMTELMTNDAEDQEISQNKIPFDLQKDHYCPRRKATIKLVDRDDFYIFDELVASEPRAFVEKLWPWLAEMVLEIIHAPHEFVDKYPGDGSHTNLDHSERITAKYSILGAMDEAISKFSEASPELYCKFFEKNKKVESLTLHRLLARGLINTVAIDQSAALSYLTEDTRRFCLGTYSSEHGDTCKLISALYPHLNQDQQKVLNKAIENYSHYVTKPSDNDVETRRKRTKWDRQHRLTLLQAIPGNLAPRDLSKLRKEEERALPQISQQEFEGGFIGSPLTSEQMYRASVDELQKLFLELNDSTRSSHPTDWSKGGTIQLSRGLLELVKRDSEKVRQLIERFKPGTNEIAAGFGVQALASVPHSSEDLYSLIINLDDRGFKSDEFRGQIAHVIHNEVVSHKTVPGKIVDLLKMFVREYSGGEPEVLIRKERNIDSSLLWQGHTDEAYSTTSTFTFIDALLSVFLVATPPYWADWIQTLESFLERTELPDYVSTWRLLALQRLVNLRFVDHTRAHKVLEVLLKTEGAPLVSISGAVLLAGTHGWLSENLVAQWLQCVRDSEWTGSGQLYGELICLHHMWFPTRPWAEELINSIVTAHKTGICSMALKGIAYTIGYLWSGPSDREKKTHLLLAILNTGDDQYYAAVSEGFTIQEFPIDEHTRQILTVMAENRAFLRALDLSSLVDILQDLVEWYPEEVYKLSLAIISEFGAAIGDIRTQYALVAGNIVDLVIRLQHQSEPARSWGLELFERLIELSIPDARAMLNSLDRRVDTGTSLQRGIPRLRRSNRRRRQAR